MSEYAFKFGNLYCSKIVLTCWPNILLKFLNKAVAGLNLSIY